VLAVILAAGAGAAWAAILWIIFGIAGNFFSPRSYEGLLVLPDGTPLIQTSSAAGTTYRTLDGKPADIADIEQQLNGAILLGREDTARHGVPWSKRIVRLNGAQDATAWFFLHDGRSDGRGYFEGYDKRTKFTTGYIGRKGFRNDVPPPEEQFPVDAGRMNRDLSLLEGRSYSGYDKPGLLPAWTVYLLADDGLVAVNLKSHKVSVVLEEPNVISCGVLTTMKTSSPQSIATVRQTIAVRLPDRVVMLDASGKRVQSYALPEELRHIDLCWYELPDGKALVADCDANKELYWLDATGRLTRHERTGLQPPWSIVRIYKAIISVAAPCPGLVTGVIVAHPWDRPDRPESMEYSVALGQAMAAWWPYLLAMWIASAMLAALGYRRQRRYGLPWTALWTTLVLLFGVPAYLGYLAHRSWPARLPCPNCGQLAPRDRACCAGCGREFPGPTPKGIEVFA
jgi:hypothetical protein